MASEAGCLCGRGWCWWRRARGGREFELRAARVDQAGARGLPQGNLRAAHARLALLEPAVRQVTPASRKQIQCCGTGCNHNLEVQESRGGCSDGCSHKHAPMQVPNGSITGGRHEAAGRALKGSIPRPGVRIRRVANQAVRRGRVQS